MSLLCLGLNHRTAPLALRERLVYTPAMLEVALACFSRGRPRRWHSQELVILSTCNRVEVYAHLPARDASGNGEDPFAPLLDVLVESRDVPVATVEKYLYRYTGIEAARHLCCVAAGLDSMVLGEPQILGQVAEAHEAALRQQTAGTVMQALFRTAMRAGRRARHETKINRKPASISSVAVHLARHVAGSLDGCRVAVVGAGLIGTLTLKTLREQGPCDVAVVSRNRTSAEQLARRWGAAAYGLEHLPEVLAAADLVITSTAALDPVLTVKTVQEAVRGRPERPLTLIDVAVPRDVDPAVRSVENVRLFDLDDLKAQAQQVIAERRSEIPRVETIIEEEVRAFQQWQRGADVMPLIADLRHKAEFTRQQEVHRALRHLPDLDPETRKQIERLSHALVNKLLHEPTTRLRFAAKAGRAAESAETVRHLFALCPNEVHAA